MAVVVVLVVLEHLADFAPPADGLVESESSLSGQTRFVLVLEFVLRMFAALPEGLAAIVCMLAKASIQTLVGWLDFVGFGRSFLFLFVAIVWFCVSGLFLYLR